MNETVNKTERFCGDPLCPCQDGDVCHYVDWKDTKAMMVPVSVHESNLRQLPCVVTDRTEGNTMHHCHSASMVELGYEWQPGMAQRANPFYQIRLNGEYHTGRLGIDGSMGIKTWEGLYGSQVSLLERVNRQLPYNLWQQARLWRDRQRERRGRGRCQRPSKILPR